MPLAKKDWHDKPDNTTPINEEGLEDLENRIEDYVEADAIAPLAGKQASATITANGLGIIAHGSTAGTVRPSGFQKVIWVGSVTPTNAVDGDLWIDTT